LSSKVLTTIEGSEILTVVKVLSALLVAIFAVIAVTFVYCYVQLVKRGLAAATKDALLIVLINSPVYWLLEAAVLAAVWWLFRGWFKTT
jgi:hypothetical protein